MSGNRNSDERRVRSLDDGDSRVRALLVISGAARFHNGLILEAPGNSNGDSEYHRVGSFAIMDDSDPAVFKAFLSEEWITQLVTIV